MDIKTINELITCLKRIVEEERTIILPLAGNGTTIKLKSTMFYFLLDMHRKGYKRPKCTMQLRDAGHKDSPLLRLDLLGSPHPNPRGDFPHAGETIPCPHLHVAHPDYGISIAYPLNSTYAKMFLTDEELEDLITVLQMFLERCNVANLNDYNFAIQTELL